MGVKPIEPLSHVPNEEQKAEILKWIKILYEYKTLKGFAIDNIYQERTGITNDVRNGGISYMMHHFGIVKYKQIPSGNTLEILTNRAFGILDAGGWDEWKIFIEEKRKYKRLLPILSAQLNQATINSQQATLDAHLESRSNQRFLTRSNIVALIIAGVTVAVGIQQCNISNQQLDRDSNQQKEVEKVKESIQRIVTSIDSLNITMKEAVENQKKSPVAVPDSVQGSHKTSE